MATTRIYKVQIAATDGITLLVDAMTPASAKRVLAERLISCDVASGKDIIAAMRDGAEVVSVRDDDAETLPLALDAPTDPLGVPVRDGETIGEMSAAEVTADKPRRKAKAVA